MIRKSFLAFIFIFFAAGSDSRSQAGNNGEKTVYIINYAWHTGYVLPVDSSLTGAFPFMKDFSQYKFIDIGWGDRDFYQLEEFRLYEGARALLVPTRSAMRIEGYSLNIEKVVKYVDRVNEIKMSVNNYNRLLDFINSYISLNSSGRPVLLSIKSGGRIAFFAAEGEYHLYNTCNTWIAKGLKHCGYKINPDWISTEEEIFREVNKISKKLR